MLSEAEPLLNPETRIVQVVMFKPEAAARVTPERQNKLRLSQKKSLQQHF